MSWLDLPFAGDFTRRRGEADPYGPLGAEESLIDYPDGQFDELGVEMPDMQSPPDESFDVSPADMFFESLAGNLRGVQAPRPRNFLEGLAVGGVQGLSARGLRTMSAREKFDKRREERRKAIDEGNKQATQRYQMERGGELRARRGEGRINARADAQEAARLERESVQVTPEMVAAHPELQGVKRVPVAKWIEIQTPKEKKAEKERLVAIEGKNGPIYVRESDALGQPPPKPAGAQAGKLPTATERAELSRDVTALDQSARIKNFYKPQFVGPLSGGIGGAAAGLGGPLGAVRRAVTGPGESDFKSALATYRNAVINALSGAAVSESEAKRMQQQIPHEGDPSEQFEAKMRQTEENLRSVARRRRQIYGETGLDLSGLSALPGEPTYKPGGFFDANRPGAR